MESVVAKTLRKTIDVALRGELDETLAHKLHKLGPKAVALAALSMCRRIGEKNDALTRLETRGGKPSPSTPSGMVPVYTKPNNSKRHKNPGAKPWHGGVRRERPVKIDEREDHRLECCPHSSGELQRSEQSRTRLTVQRKVTLQA
jgi:hypothetical protein